MAAAASRMISCSPQPGPMRERSGSQTARTKFTWNQSRSWSCVSIRTEIDTRVKKRYSREHRGVRSREGSITMMEIESLAKLGEYVGREVAVSRWLDVTQERINQFAEATEDRE